MQTELVTRLAEDAREKRGLPGETDKERARRAAEEKEKAALLLEAEILNGPHDAFWERAMRARKHRARMARAQEGMRSRSGTLENPGSMSASDLCDMMSQMTPEEQALLLRGLDMGSRVEALLAMLMEERLAALAAMEAVDAAETLMAFPRLDRMETITAMGPAERARILMELEEKDR